MKKVLWLQATNAEHPQRSAVGVEDPFSPLQGRSACPVYNRQSIQTSRYRPLSARSDLINLHQFK